MKVKKILSVFLVAAMLGGFAGCGQEKDTYIAKKVAIEQSEDSVVQEYVHSEIGLALKEETVYQLPAEWDYQFDSIQIGSFKGYTNEDAGTIDMEDGEVFGFDDRLTMGCSAWCGCETFVCEAQASSTLADQGTISYAASNLTEACRDSVWAEGVEGDGIGESICIKQMYAGTGDAEFIFNSICIVNGYAENERKWQENGRVKSLKLYYEDEYMGLITLEDTMKPQYIDISPVQMKVGNGINANFRFEIAEIYEGSKYEDTCITGIVIDFEGKYAH